MLYQNNCYYCNYFKKYSCPDCFSSIKSLIPAKIISCFDFNFYSVSKLGYREINQNYDLPILEIKYENELVLKNDELYSFLVN